MRELKQSMKEQARVIRGLTNALGYDAEYLFTDVENYDLICLGESLHETKITLQKLVDNVTELEYTLYLIRRDAE